MKLQHLVEAHQVPDTKGLEAEIERTFKWKTKVSQVPLPDLRLVEIDIPPETKPDTLEFVVKLMNKALPAMGRKYLGKKWELMQIQLATAAAPNQKRATFRDFEPYKENHPKWKFQLRFHFQEIQ